MQRFAHFRIWLLASALLCAALQPAHAALDIVWGDIQDPRLREAIFDLNDEEYFTGIIRLVTNRNPDA